MIMPFIKLNNPAWFKLILLLIICGGLVLRLIDYDRLPPWRESDDEIHYGWAGWSWLTQGTPTSWSFLSAYPTSETITVWSSNWRMVTPMLEKPPLYLLLSGLTLVASGATDWSSARLSVLRLLPISLSLVTLLFIALVGSRVFSKHTALVATLLYAVVPTFVQANRLSLTESLLTPLSLILVWLLMPDKSPSNHSREIGVGVVVGLGLLTKQNGISFLFAAIAVWVYLKNWRGLLITSVIAAGLGAIFPLIGGVYDWNLFLKISAEQRRIGLQGGLPQFITTLLTRPLIGTERLFLDGTPLLGHLLLLCSPWWITQDQDLSHIRNRLIFLSFPLAYLLTLVLTLSGAEALGSGQAFWGWYAYPLFPYLIILIAHVFHRLWQKFSFLQLLLLILLLGSSSIRFALLFLPRAVHYRWQWLLVALVGFSVATAFFPKKTQRLLLWVLFAIFVGINIFTTINLKYILPTLSQPLL